MYDEISPRSRDARPTAAGSPAAACSRRVAAPVQVCAVRSQRTRAARSFRVTTPRSASARSRTVARSSNAATLMRAACALPALASRSRTLAAYSRPSVAPVATAPSAVTRMTRTTTLRARDRLNDSHQLVGVERLADEGVRARVRSGAPVGVRLPRGHDDHRRRRRRGAAAELGEELEPALPRQHHVEDDGVDAGVLEQCLGLG